MHLKDGHILAIPPTHLIRAVTMMTTPLFIDADNTFGVPECDIDDGIAILYALGVPQVRIVGISCTHGNAGQDVVYENTQRFMVAIGRTDIPVYRGATQPLEADNLLSPAHLSSIPAVQALIEASKQHEGSLHILATGGLTNLACAALVDPSFFSRIAALSIMGGVTEPLIINGTHLPELNFSCDPIAAYHTLTSSTRTTTILAHAQSCLASQLLLDDCTFSEYPTAQSSIMKWVLDRAKPWVISQQHLWNMRCTILWDVLAAAALLGNRQQLCGGRMRYADSPCGCTLCTESIHLNQKLLAYGHIPLAQPSNSNGHTLLRPVLIPKITDRRCYTEHIYHTINRANITLLR